MNIEAAVALAKGLLEQLFMSSAPTQLLVFVVHGLIVYAIAFTFLSYFNRKPEVLQWTPVAPFFAAISMVFALFLACLLYTSPSPRDKRQSRMPSSA